MKITTKVLTLILSPILFFLFFFPYESFSAEHFYITDTLFVNIRSDKGTGQKITTLRTNERVELLEKSDDFIKVRTDDGKEGWMQSQYITAKTPKPIIIANLKKEIALLKNETKKLKEQSGPLWKEIDDLKQAHDEKIRQMAENLSKTREEATKAIQERDRAQKDYNLVLEKSKRAVELVDTHDALTAQNTKLKAEAAHLQNEVEKLEGRRELNWFLAGAGVFFLGWLIGKISRRKKHSSLLGT